MASGVVQAYDDGKMLTIVVCSGYANGACGDKQNPDGSYSPPRTSHQFAITPPAGVSAAQHGTNCAAEALRLHDRLTAPAAPQTPHAALVGTTIASLGLPS